MDNKEDFRSWMSKQLKENGKGLYEPGTVNTCIDKLSIMLSKMGIVIDNLEDNNIFLCNDYTQFLEIEKLVRTHPEFHIKDGRGVGGERDWFSNGLKRYGEYLLGKEGTTEEQRPDNLESLGEIKRSDGKKTVYYTTKYERNKKNRDDAIKVHGLTCQCCGFNFEKYYGAIGADYIEVHHCVPLYSLNEEVIINPKTDLVCVCSNCHRMIHRNKYKTLTIEGLQKMIKKQINMKNKI